MEHVRAPEQGTPRRGVYAWGHETDEGGRRYFAVLGVPPIDSAVDAVGAAIVAQHRGGGRP